jgi:TonB family protein
MSTIVKDTEVLPVSPEVVTPRAAAGNLAAPEFVAKPQPVALEVSITVNGARSVDGTDKREPFSEASKTVLVFANGAVIRLQSSVAPGQLLFLTNEKTKKEVVCQVVKSKNYRNVSGYVELEFTEPVIGFWGMRFPGDRIVQSSPNASVPLPAALMPASSAPAIGAPAAPVASVPAAPISSPSIPASTISATAVEPSKPIVPAVAETPKPVPTKLAVPTSESQHAAPPISATPAVTANAPLKPPTSTSTPAPLDMNLLRRASDPKLRAIPAIPAVPSNAVPIATKPETPKPEIVKPLAADPTEALRAENARLQEQLSAFLGQNVKTSEQPAPAPSVPEVSTLSTLARHISEITAPPASFPDSEAKTIQSKTPEAAPSAASSSTVNVTPALAKMSSVSLDSLLDEEPVKIPAWLESLARNSATPPETKVDSELLTSPSLTSSVETQDSSVAPQLESSAQDLHGDEEPASASDASVTGVFEVPAPSFGSNSMFSDEQTSAEGAAKSKKGLVFAAIAAGVLIAAGGGYWYTHQDAAIFGGAQRSPHSASAAQPNLPVAAPGNSASTADAQVQPSSTANVSSTHSASAVKDAAVVPAPVNANTTPTAGRSVQPATSVPAAVGSPADAKSAAAPPKKSALGAVHLSAPTVSRKSGGPDVGDADVALNSSADAGDAALSATFASSSGPAAPTPSIPVGGDVKSAKLLKSVPPVYPAFAKTQRVSGDVRVDALVDAEGRVTTMKIVSGPAMLHLAAMDALRQWKYQPATLDGKAVSMHLTVTIQFRLQ